MKRGTSERPTATGTTPTTGTTISGSAAFDNFRDMAGCGVFTERRAPVEVSAAHSWLTLQSGSDEYQKAWLPVVRMTLGARRFVGATLAVAWWQVAGGWGKPSPCVTVLLLNC